MANVITGTIAFIGGVQRIPSKDGSRMFSRRELVIDATRYDRVTGKRGYDNFPSIEFIGDHCDDLSLLHRGQLVSVSFSISGVRYKAADGTIKYFNKIQGYRVELIEKASAGREEPQQEEDDTPF